MLLKKGPIVGLLPLIGGIVMSITRVLLQVDGSILVTIMGQLLDLKEIAIIVSI